jgi:phosphomannomutase
MFGEEYTLVAVADYVLSKTPGNTVSNMSSSRALRDITEKHGGTYQASAVGEVNVVELMKKTNAIIGGEGNGGIIYPSSHYGRDSMVGVALFLTYLANQNKTVAEIRASYPQYFMSKNKIELTPQIDVDNVLAALTEKYKSENSTTIDGVKIDFPEEWVHLRKSNTEPIIRIYTEAPTQAEADILAERFVNELKEIAGI